MRDNNTASFLDRLRERSVVKIHTYNDEIIHTFEMVSRSQGKMETKSITSQSTFNSSIAVFATYDTDIISLFRIDFMILCYYF